SIPPMLSGLFGIFEFLLAPPVAPLFDDLAGGGEVVSGAAGAAIWVGAPGVDRGAVEEAAAVQVNVGEVQLHGAALGDLPRLVQVGDGALLTGGGLRLAKLPVRRGLDAVDLGAKKETVGEIILATSLVELRASLSECIN